jgi:hypothetical protein
MTKQAAGRKKETRTDSRAWPKRVRLGPSMMPPCQRGRKAPPTMAKMRPAEPILASLGERALRARP